MAGESCPWPQLTSSGATAARAQSPRRRVARLRYHTASRRRCMKAGLLVIRTLYDSSGDSTPARAGCGTARTVGDIKGQAYFRDHETRALTRLFRLGVLHGTHRVCALAESLFVLPSHCFVLSSGANRSRARGSSAMAKRTHPLQRAHSPSNSSTALPVGSHRCNHLGSNVGRCASSMGTVRSAKFRNSRKPS